MAITATLAKATAHSLQYILTHDGQAGDTLVLAAATMIADLVGEQAQGPLLQMMLAGANPNSQAIARARMLGDASALASQNLEGQPGCAQVDICPRAGGVAFGVDADVDAVTATRWELNITAAATAAGTSRLNINFQHSVVR